MSSTRLYYESMGPYAPKSQTWYHHGVKASYSLPLASPLQWIVQGLRSLCKGCAYGIVCLDPGGRDVFIQRGTACDVAARTQNGASAPLAGSADLLKPSTECVAQF